MGRVKEITIGKDSGSVDRTHLRPASGLIMQFFSTTSKDDNASYLAQRMAEAYSRRLPRELKDREIFYEAKMLLRPSGEGRTGGYSIAMQLYTKD